MPTGVPGAQAVATAGTIAGVRVQASDEYRHGFWDRLFPGQIPAPVIPAELVGDTIGLEEHELRVIDAGHTDAGSGDPGLGDLRAVGVAPEAGGPRERRGRV